MIRFYIDEDLSPIIAQAAREHGLDIISCHEVGNQKLSDPEQLAFATAQGRCLLTGNGRDFEDLTNELYLAAQPHAGVAAVPGTWRRNDYARASYSRSSPSPNSTLMRQRTTCSSTSVDVGVIEACEAPQEQTDGGAIRLWYNRRAERP